jgi:ubiquinone/menaquinone biosynthesis C-methylase UbiE
MKKGFIILFIIIALSSCTLMNRIFLRNKISAYQGHSTHCRLYTENDSTEIKFFDGFVEITGIKNNDTVLSIGAGSGGREFLISLYTDSILFYLEDIDTSCITKSRINNTYIPHYTKLRGKPITNSFITVAGTDKKVEMLDNSVNKILVYNVYHHFSDDMAMVNECNRILRKNGKLIICEHVTKRDKKSYKFCDYGGYYKTQEHFTGDIENSGFTCEYVLANGNHWRLFIFNKN